MVAAVLSGNRNFEGRINSAGAANYLASPPLVVAYALAGRVDIDLQNEPIGVGTDGAAGLSARHLADAGGSGGGCAAIRAHGDVRQGVRGGLRGRRQVEVHARCPTGDVYQWDDESTYIKKPPYFDKMVDPEAPVHDFYGHARAGDAGRFGHDGPHLAGRFDRGGQPGGTVSDRAGREAGGLQFLRRAARQS